MKNLIELQNSPWERNWIINDRLEVIPEGIYGNIIFLVNEIKKILNLDHFTVDPEIVIPELEKFVEKNKDSLNDRFSKILTDYSWSQCSNDQAKRILALIVKLENVPVIKIPPRRINVRKLVAYDSLVQAGSLAQAGSCAQVV